MVVVVAVILVVPVLLFPVPVILALDDVLIRPVARRVPPAAVFAHVNRGNPASVMGMQALPAAGNPRPPPSLPIPVSLNPEVAVARAMELVFDPRWRRGVEREVNFQIR